MWFLFDLLQWLGWKCKIVLRYNEKYNNYRVLYTLLTGGSKCIIFSTLLNLYNKDQTRFFYLNSNDASLVYKYKYLSLMTHVGKN